MGTVAFIQTPPAHHSEGFSFLQKGKNHMFKYYNTLQELIRAKERTAYLIDTRDDPFIDKQIEELLTQTTKETTSPDKGFFNA